ncbi:MAG TPA: hypothetical protein VNK70_03225 [Candidatus Paceibacterota bacterium]|nr:hypothetical protein [Candidatus Paceibacterota bacterium]
MQRESAGGEPSLRPTRKFRGFPQEERKLSSFWIVAAIIALGAIIAVLTK